MINITEKIWLFSFGRAKKEEFGKRVDILTRVFGCWHRKGLSRPFFDSEMKQAYRVCLQCGARRRFDTESLKTIGSFYFPSAKSPSRKI